MAETADAAAARLVSLLRAADVRLSEHATATVFAFVRGIYSRPTPPVAARIEALAAPAGGRLYGTHAEIAEQIGSHRETVTRELGRLGYRRERYRVWVAP